MPNNQNNQGRKSFFANIDKRIIKSLTIYGIIIAIFILALILSFSIIKKQGSAIKNTRIEYSTLLQQSEIYSNLQKNAKLLLPYTKNIQNLIPDKNHLIDFSEYLNQLANKHNLELGLVFKEVGADDEKKIVFQNIDQATFSINIRGTSDDFLAFIKDLKTFPYFIDFYNFNITSTGVNADKKEVFSYNIEGKVFIQK
ncbi:MAG: hypothetical protein N2692_02030 [Patescibacteria group bacterium]|nr:hypothetical protein [Patescibacteria group bacterium]